MSAHKPVLLKEVIENLNIRDGGTYIDCTFGAGGYSEAILNFANCRLISLDQDPTTLVFAENLSKKFGDRFRFVNDNFRNLDKLQLSDEKIDGIVYDFGVSSMQLDNKERGFSFQENAKLDMRMGISGSSAYDIINNYDEKELADIIYNYGDERASRKIAKKIIEKRSIEPINTTFELADIIRSVVKKTGRIDPSTKTFQAIRIAVNDELGAINDSISKIKNILKIGGRAVFVSFHSLEDKIIKSYFKDNSDPKIAISKYSKEKTEFIKPFKIITNKAIVPSRGEQLENPRSRSAKMRVFERVV